MSERAMTETLILERIIQVARTVAPGHERYRAYVVHWANAEFKQFVSDLEQVATRALAESNGAEAAEQAFLQVAHLEHDFWEMAWSGGGGR